MKFLFIFTLLIAGVCAFRGYTQGHNGRPGCTTDEEKANTLWRNNYDSTNYWECVTHGEPGVARICKTEFMFQPDLNKCVHYTEWEWTPLEDPPEPIGQLS